MKYGPRIKETTTTIGTGTYTLAGPVTGFQGFVSGGVPVGENTWYCCTNGTDWEIGVGTIVGEETNTLTRDVVLESSNSDTAVDWLTGSKEVFCIFPTYLMRGLEADWHTFAANNFIMSDENSNRNIAIGQQNQIAGTDNIAIGVLHKAWSTSAQLVLLGTSCGVAIGSNELFFSSGGLNYAGDSQLKIKIAVASTENATEAGFGYFRLSGSIDSTGTALFEISVVARQTAGTSGTIGDSKSWKLDCMVTFASGVLAQVGTTVSSVIAASAGASAWACDIDVSENENGPIRITGEANKTIHWVSYIRSIENSTGMMPPSPSVSPSVSPSGGG